jgi:hypothetical protein
MSPFNRIALRGIALRRIALRRIACGTSLAFLAVFVAGCGGTGADKQLDATLKELKTTRPPIGRFSGKVTVDGQPPSVGMGGEALLVIMYNPESVPTPRHPPSFARCEPDGSFQFTTFSLGDGLPVGKYIVLFAQLKGHHGSYLPPDKLLNLYNDPDKNAAERPEFNIDLTTKGKTDQLFNLDVAGRDSVENPGPKAVVGIGAGARSGGK